MSNVVIMVMIMIAQNDNGNDNKGNMLYIMQILIIISHKMIT